MKDSRDTQRGTIFELLRSRAGQWVSLPEILSLGFAQFGARILELRRHGHTILNKTEHRDGKVLSWYKLELGAVSKVPQSSQKAHLQPTRNLQRSETQSPPVATTGSLFGDLSQDRSYQE
jgi:hypothetical protein